jgi:hypothetical protein
MKKTIALLFIAVFAVGYTYAQQNKQVAGSKNLEVLFAPLGGSPISLGGIKYRSFSSETSAMRVAVFVGLQSSTDVMLGGSDGETEMNSKSGSFDISVRPGLEKHFTGTDKLSPYIGGEVLIGFSSNVDKVEDYDFIEDEIYEETTKNGSLTFGLNALAGVDYYFAQNIYLGAEFGFGFSFESMNDTKFESTQNDVDDVTSPNGSGINLGPNAVGQIRLGWLF